MAELDVEIVAVERELWSGKATFVFTRTTAGEIGILRAMGATRNQVLRVFLLQGVIVGALGSALGVLLAVALIWLFTHFVRGSDGLPLFNIALEAGLALRIAGLATVCGLLAAVAPARRAARLDPAQAIRL